MEFAPTQGLEPTLEHRADRVWRAAADSQAHPLDGRAQPLRDPFGRGDPEPG